MPLTYVFHESPADLATAAADFIATRIRSVVATSGECLIAVAGGTTPAPIYRELSRLDIDWPKVVFVQTDERITPQPTERVAGMIATSLGLTTPERRGSWHPIQVGGNGQDIAAAYDEQLVRLRPEGVPDIAVLGLGTDGHTASIFDHTHGEVPYQRVVTSTYHGEQRVSLGLEYLQAVPTRILLAAGAGKRAALAEILAPTPGGAPASAAVVLGQNGYILADAEAHPGQV